MTEIEKIKNSCEKIYPIDGIVVKYDDIEYGKSLGETAHHFNNAIRYKFYDEEYECYVCDVCLDEDEMAGFLESRTNECHYYRFYDEYKSVQKQI